MSTEEDEEHRNFIEAKIIIQEFHDDPTVFIVGTAPFGKLWFDQDKVNQQYKVLTDTWHEEYGDAETKHSKRPRIINVLLDEKDAMFNKYRDNIREAQEKKQQEEEAEAEKIQKQVEDENVVVENEPNEINININVDAIPQLSTTKKTTKTPKIKATKKNDTGKSTPSESPTETPVKKRGRPKKQQTDIKGAFSAATTTK